MAHLSFDAFGKRRSAVTWSGPLSSAELTLIAELTHRGYTFHEGLDNVDLVHMNGRVYDPNIARFISADPFIQAPFMSQSLNRYSYVVNNPLSLIDPSGFSWLSKQWRSVKKFFKKYWKQIVATAIAIVGTVATLGTTTGFWWAVAKGAMAGGIYGGTFTALNGGDLGQIFRGALTGAIAGAIAAGVSYGIGQLVQGSTSPPIDFGWENLSPSSGESIAANLSSTGIDPSILRGVTAARDEGSTVGGNGFNVPSDQRILLASLARPTNTIEAGIQRAILRGDAGELRVLLGEASLNPNDLLIAQRALTAIESIGSQDAALLASRYGVNFANKVTHAFGRASHNLSPVVKEFGSAAKTFVEAQRAVDAAYAATGTFPTVIQIGSFSIRVSGAVSDGVPLITTLFIP